MKDREAFAIQTRSKAIKDTLPSSFPESDDWSYPIDAVMKGQDVSWDEQAHLLVGLD